MQRFITTLVLLFLLNSSLVFSQKIILSPKAELSVITCGPGYNELYATFGHSAFRIRDIPNKIDRVYNYGTFNFETPNFYLKFAQGKLLYELRAYNFGAFLRGYKIENRWVKGQVLNLTHSEIQKVFNYLEYNAKPENRAYKYDFFYDNCSTKLYDVLEKILEDRIVFDNNFDQRNLTHRDLIHEYTKYLPWSEFGIDLALGSDIDKKASAKEYMFLPDYVMKAFTKIKIVRDGKQTSIIKRTEDILFNNEKNIISKNTNTPLILFSLLAVIVIIITYRDYKNKTRNKILDFLIFFTTGLTGVVILLLWFATDHAATANNFNVFWAFAPNLLFVFINKNKLNITFYYLITLLALLDILLVIWFFKIQIFAIALIPILILLYIRYLYLWIFFKRKIKKPT